MTVQELRNWLTPLINGGKGHYKVMLRCDYGDLIIGGRAEAVRVDGFHEHVNLIGPVVKPEPIVDQRDLQVGCQKRQIAATKGGYVVQQCRNKLAHGKRHSYSTISSVIPTMAEAYEWLTGKPMSKREETIDEEEGK